MAGQVAAHISHPSIREESGGGGFHPVSKLWRRWKTTLDLSEKRGGVGHSSEPLGYLERENLVSSEKNK